MSKRKPNSDQSRKIISEAMGRIEHARNHRNKLDLPGRWQRHLNLYKGLHFPSTSVNEDVDIDRIAVNVSKVVIDTIWPSITLEYPQIDVEAVRPEHEDNAFIAQLALNYDFRRWDLKRPLNTAAKNALITGTGFVKVGWKFVEADTELSEAEMEEQYVKAIDELDAFIAENPDMEGDAPTDEQVAAQIQNTARKVIEDRPIVEWVPNEDLFIDPEARSWDDAQFLAHRTYMTRDQLLDNAAFDPVAAKMATPTHRNPFDDRQTRNEQPRDERLYCVWEYWNLHTYETFTFVEGSSDKFLIAPRKSPFGFQPFEAFIDYEVPGEVYGMGELDSVEPLQQELNKTRTQILNARKKYGRKYLYDPEVLSPTAVGVLQNTEDCAYAPIEEGGDLAAAIRELPSPPIPEALLSGTGPVLDDIMLVSGRNEYQMGISDTAARTATESSIINDVARSRAREKLARYEDFVNRVARKVLKLNQKFLTGEQAVRIVGKDGAKYWFYYDPTWIEGEFDLIVQSGSTAPTNEGQKRREANELANTLAPFIAQGIVNPQVVAEEILKAYGHQNTGKFFAPPPMAPGAPVDPNAAPMPPDGATPPQPQPEQPGVTPMQVAQQGLDPALVNQLQGQVGLQVASPDQGRL